jgi:hypothetical protein
LKPDWPCASAANSRQVNASVVNRRMSGLLVEYSRHSKSL